MENNCADFESTARGRERILTNSTIMSKLDGMTSNLDIKTILVGLILSIMWVAIAKGDADMQLKRVTTVVFSDDVDACTAFYIQRLGFEQTMAVPAQQPGETGSQFAAVSNGTHELMFQTFKSAEEDAPGAVARANPPSFMLYIEVSSLDAAIGQMHGLEPAISRRKTFYGSEEIGYRDPNGTVVVLAEFSGAPQAPSSDEADGQ